MNPKVIVGISTIAMICLSTLLLLGGRAIYRTMWEEVKPENRDNRFRILALMWVAIGIFGFILLFDGLQKLV